MTNIGRKFCGLINNKDNLKLQLHLLSPANEVCEGSVFTGVCLSVGSMCSRGACVVGKACMAGGRHTWQGSMCGVGCAWWGVCMMGACMVGVGVWQEHMWYGGICDRGHVWRGEGACMAGETVCSEWYASYWNAFLL